MNNPLRTIHELITTIKEYESDTFCAEAVGLTNDEACDLAGYCIEWFINNRLDGVVLDEWLEIIREKREENEHK
jgi:hypothetical protein